MASVPLLVLEDVSPDMLDCLRFEKELETACSLHKTYAGDTQPVLLIDGALALWYLENESPSVRQEYLQKFLKKFDDLYGDRVLHAAYVSNPKSTELIKLLSEAATVYGQQEVFQGVCDADIFFSICLMASERRFLHSIQEFFRVSCASSSMVLLR